MFGGLFEVLCEVLYRQFIVIALIAVRVARKFGGFGRGGHWGRVGAILQSPTFGRR